MRGHASPYSNMAAPGTAAGAATATALVQYVVLRGDLARSWSLGAVVAQGCHAALAAAHAHWHHPDTRAYLSAGGAMRTVVLEVRGAWRERRAEGSGRRPFWGGVFTRLWVPRVVFCVAALSRFPGWGHRPWGCSRTVEMWH